MVQHGEDINGMCTCYRDVKMANPKYSSILAHLVLFSWRPHWNFDNDGTLFEPYYQNPSLHSRHFCWKIIQQLTVLLASSRIWSLTCHGFESRQQTTLISLHKHTYYIHISFLLTGVDSNGLMQVSNLLEMHKLCT